MDDAWVDQVNAIVEETNVIFATILTCYDSRAGITNCKRASR